VYFAAVRCHSCTKLRMTLWTRLWLWLCGCVVVVVVVGARLVLEGFSGISFSEEEVKALCIWTTMTATRSCSLK
jgi:hypothetical protein